MIDNESNRQLGIRNLSVKWKFSKLKLADEKVCVVQVEVQMVVFAVEDVGFVHNIESSNCEAALTFYSDTHLLQPLLDILILLRVAVNYFWDP